MCMRCVGGVPCVWGGVWCVCDVCVWCVCVCVYVGGGVTICMGDVLCVCVCVCVCVCEWIAVCFLCISYWLYEIVETSLM